METPGSGDDPSKVIRLPRRPRRVTEESGGRPRGTWCSQSGSVFDPAPTKPVLRSDLQRETGWWPVVPVTAPHPAAENDPDSADYDGNVVHLDASRRKHTRG